MPQITALSYCKTLQQLAAQTPLKKLRL